MLEDILRPLAAFLVIGLLIIAFVRLSDHRRGRYGWSSETREEERRRIEKR